MYQVEKTSLDEAMQAAESLTVEFGPADTPLFETQTARAFNNRNLYVGVNIDPAQHRYLERKVSSIGGFAILAEIDLDGEIDFPIPEGSADMAYLANVLGEPDSPYIMPQFQNKEQKYKGHSDIDAKRRTLSKAISLLKPGGQLVILETNTPYNGSMDGGSHRDTATTLLKPDQFASIEEYRPKNPDWEEKAGAFTTPNDWWSYFSYLVIATKQ
jgi:SAM-dependent methyltransferase